MLKTRINQFINNKVTTRPPPPIQLLQQLQPPSSGQLHEKNLKITHGKSHASDLFTADFEINDVRIAARNILTKGQTHDEIAQHSGASISTRGRYISPVEKARGISNDRPLYLFIQSDTKKSLELAIEKIKEIIANTQHSPNTVANSINRMSKFNTRPPLTMAPQQTANQANSTFIEKLMIGLEHAPPTFNVREQVIGVGGANLQYIRNETGAIATLRGRGSLFIDPVLGTESPESLHLFIEHQRFDGLQAAKQLAKNLIETLQQEVVHLQQQTSQNTQNVAISNNNSIIQQGQHVTHLNVPPPMLVPPPVIQQNSLESQANQAAIVQQNFIQQNPPPNLGGPPQTVQSQQQTIIHQQIIPQTVPIQLQQSNVVIQQPVQQQATALGNVNIPPPGIPIPIKSGQIVQFQTPPPTAPGTAHLTQPPPNIQLQHQPPAATQIVLNHPQGYQYQYIQQPVQQQDPGMQPNQVTIQHIYQPQQQIQGIVQQTQPQPQAQQIQATPTQQYITVQGSTAYMMPPPTIIHQPQASQQAPHAQVQTQITASNPNIIFQPPPQLQQVQMQVTPGFSVQNMPPALTSNTTTVATQDNSSQSNNSEESNNNNKEETKSEGDQTESPQKSPKIKTEGDSHSNDSDNESGNQNQTVSTAANVTLSVPPPQPQTIAIKHPPPSVATSITLPVTQMAPPIMAVPPPMSCVQHFVGNTLITTQPTAQTHTHQIYSQVPVSIQQITQAGQPIHVSAPNGQHFLVNATPQWQAPPPTTTLTQQSPIQHISQNGTIQNVQIATAQQIAHNGTDFRAIPPPTLVSQATSAQPGQQHPLAVAFNPQVQVQFQPQLVQQLPPPQTIEQTQMMSGHVTAAQPQQQFNMIQQQQPQISYQQTVVGTFPTQQQSQIKSILYQEQTIRLGQKRKHENDDSALLNHQPRMGMGQRDQNQPMHPNQLQQSLHQAPPMPLASHGNLPVIQTTNGSSSSNAGQDETGEQKAQSDLQQQLAQPPPPPPPPTGGAFPDNRSYYQRDMSESFGDGPIRQSFDGPLNNGGPGLRGPRFHHNNGMMGPGYPMRPPFHMPPDGNGGNFPMHRMNFGPPPPPPPSYRGDCPPNMSYGPPPRFRGQW
ncbi:MAGE-like protein 2 isoform X1 [Hermetia illucens]|nr:MAGE-like protein 2 isoform X1 [Hermetia illucens]